MPGLRSKTRNLREEAIKTKSNRARISSEKNKKCKPAQKIEVQQKSKPKNCKKVQKRENVDSDEDGFVEIGERSDPRKRRDPSKWKRNLLAKAKRDNYKQQSTSSVPKCVHKRGHFKCSEISDEDVRFIRGIYAGHTKTVDQNRFILSQVIVDAVQRHRPRNGSRRQKSVTPSFFLRLKSAKRIRVCKVAFGTVLGVGRGRLSKLISFYNKNGEAKHESRGGDHKIAQFSSKRASVMGFIKKLKARESHYGRNKSRRLYLPHELKSIRNLCRIYNENHEKSKQVKYGFFRGIFINHFNLAFGTPRTDVCSFCLRIKHQLLIEKDPGKKQLIRTRLRIHKLKYKAFYKLLKDRKSHVKTMAGDCQQNQPLPKIPVQEAYFSRQLNMYNFTIAEYMSKDETSNFAYLWTEDESKKGSNQIASAVFHKLTNANYESKSIVRLFADGCGGQNKNVQMICMAAWWIIHRAPESVDRIQLVFPVTGHSFLPPDRVFGRIEKKIRKEEEIVSPEEYHKIIEMHESILRLGNDWEVYDWKKYAAEHLKSTAAFPFKISQTKIFEIVRSKSDSNSFQIKAEKSYRSVKSRFESICKKGSN